jgi:hypothetical protein
MLSLIAGYELGVAKRASPILARVPRRDALGLGATLEDWTAALSKVNDDLDRFQAGRTGDTATAVVLMAIYFPRTKFFVLDTDFSGPITATWTGILRSMVAKGAVLVTGSGNANKDNLPDVDGFPAAFGANAPINGWPLVPELLVAGAVFPADGSISSITKTHANGLPNIWAPGDSLYTANGNKAGWPDGEIAPGSKGTSDGS